MSHEVEVGTYVDLRHLNTGRQQPKPKSKTPLSQVVYQSFPVKGYEYRVLFKSARRIPVVFA